MTQSTRSTDLRAGETIKDYGNRSDVGLWTGWVENSEGNVVGFVAQSGLIYRSMHEGPVSLRTKAWNSVRAAVRHALSVPPSTNHAEFTDSSNLAACLSVVLNAIQSTPTRTSSSSPDEQGRIDYVCRQIETLLAFSKTFGLLTLEPQEDELVGEVATGCREMAGPVA